MPGNCLAFGPGLRKAGSLSDSYLFVRAASNSTESKKNFIHNIVGFILKETGSGVGCFSEDAFYKVPSPSGTGPFPYLAHV